MTQFDFAPELGPNQRAKGAQHIRNFRVDRFDTDRDGMNPVLIENCVVLTIRTTEGTPKQILLDGSPDEFVQLAQVILDFLRPSTEKQILDELVQIHNLLLEIPDNEDND